MGACRCAVRAGAGGDLRELDSHLERIEDWLGGGGTAYGTVNNCTISGNSAVDSGGGAYGGTLSNGMAWDGVGNVMYYIDTPTLEVWAFDWNRATGALSRKRMPFVLEKLGHNGEG